MERRLVRIGGADVALGRPYLYETTRKFLELFGLCDLADLPNVAVLRRPLKIAASEGNDDESGQIADDLVEIDDELDADDELGQENW